MTAGIYIHIPFCHRKCDYCSFYSVSVKDQGFTENHCNAFFNALVSEMRDRFESLGPLVVDSIYCGGGTPSIIEPAYYDTILNLISTYCTITPDVEISIECNPLDISKEKLQALQSLGYTRFILGVQTLNRDINEAIGRSELCPDTTQLDSFFNFKNILHCVDIITGIPQIEKKTHIQDIEEIVSYNPDHISLYLLTVSDNTPLKQRIHNIDDHGNFQIDIFRSVKDILVEKGYIHYEISNFSKPGLESIHNMKYWTFQPYIGFGPGAHSFYNKKRYYSKATVSDYLQKKYHIIEDMRSPEAAMIEYIMTGLRLTKGISLPYMEKVLGSQIPQSMLSKIDRLTEKKIINYKNSNNDIVISLTEEALFLADSVIYEIVEELL